MMEYLGYQAHIEYDPEKDQFHGRVVNAGPYPIANFIADETNQIYPEFQKSVDLYLAACREDGVTPRTPAPAPEGPATVASPPRLKSRRRHRR